MLKRRGGRGSQVASGPFHTGYAHARAIAPPMLAMIVRERPEIAEIVELIATNMFEDACGVVVK